MQTRDSETFTARQLANLLELSLADSVAADTDADSAVAEFLASLLASPLPSAAPHTEARGVVLGRQPAAAPGARTVGETLLDPHSPLEAVQAVKDYGKRLSHRVDYAEKTAGAAIYYAAIASGLLFHDRTITSLDEAALADALDRMIHSPWLPKPLTEHLAKARRL